MGQDVVLDIDDEVLERLEQRAAAAQKSLEQFLREALTEVAKSSLEEAEGQDARPVG